MVDGSSNGGQNMVVWHSWFLMGTALAIGQACLASLEIAIWSGLSGALATQAL